MNPEGFWEKKYRMTEIEAERFAILIWDAGMKALDAVMAILKARNEKKQEVV